MASIDTAQLTALYQQQHRWLRSWLYRQLSCSHRAADLMQDTFMRLLASNEALEIRQPRPFLAKVARSVLSNHYSAALEPHHDEAVASAAPGENTPGSIAVRCNRQFSPHGCLW
ncbi:sigma factor [Pseudomonas mosselii]